MIGSVSARKGVDDATRFVAAAFGSAKIPKRVDLAEDGRFVAL